MKCRCSRPGVGEGGSGASQFCGSARAGELAIRAGVTIWVGVAHAREQLLDCETSVQTPSPILFHTHTHILGACLRCDFFITHDCICPTAPNVPTLQSPETLEHIHTRPQTCA